MTVSMILRICMVVLGIWLFITSFMSYSYKKMNEKLAIGWCVFSVILVLLGAVPALAGWSTALCHTSYIGLFIVLFVTLWLMFKLSEYVSVLTQKNQELAMHVSLLNQENERILMELQRLTGKSKAEL